MSITAGLGRASSARRELSDWFSLLALTVMWGSSFLFTKIAVSALAMETVVSTRLVMAALILVPLMLGLSRRLPRGRRLWLFFVLIALVGNLLPFSLITWGQRSIDSGLAGILMAVMPLATLALAHLFVPGERLTPYRIGGFLLGFAGVVVLIGRRRCSPSAVTTGRCYRCWRCFAARFSTRLRRFSPDCGRRAMPSRPPPR